ncbi:MAG: GGDEF domain-containing protein, partial [Aquabacterium sp.]|uniref:GGDEF domain-containing protein n=1 Tax=Aquabacterium sp. TaxID=1872578 RepID=UPI003BAFADE7
LKMQKNFKQLLSKLAGFTAETDKQALDFDTNLQSYGESLKQNLDPAMLETLIGNMSGDTDKMRGSMQNLKDELASSKQEVEKLHQELESARGEALTDPLTGILNRRGFEAEAKKCFDNKETLKLGMSLLMVDIDHFKKVNDTYGHLFGDKVITAIASALKSKVKGQDIVARLGGEEFAVLLPETNLAGAQSVAENIRRSIEASKIRRHDDQAPIGGITISIGIAIYEKDANLVELLDQADKALYVSKESGRNRTSVYSVGALLT